MVTPHYQGASVRSLLLLAALMAEVLAARPAWAGDGSTAQTVPQTPAPAPGYGPGEAGFASLRLGILPSNGTQFVVGVDVTLPRLGLSPSFVTRVDADIFSPFNTRTLSNTPRSRLGLTLNEVYMGDPRANHGPYAGIGIGAYFPVRAQGVHFGSKLFLGERFSRLFSAELGVHFPGSDQTIVSLEGRIALY